MRSTRAACEFQHSAIQSKGRPMAARFSFLPQRLPLDRPLFHSAVHSHLPAKRPPVFNQDGRFSLHQPLLFVATATNNCPAIGVAVVVRLSAFLLCCPQQSARETTVSLQPRRPFFSLYREKKSAEKRENLDTAKEETPSAAYGAESGVSFCLPCQMGSSRIAAVRHCTAKKVDPKRMLRTPQVFPPPPRIFAMPWYLLVQSFDPCRSFHCSVCSTETDTHNFFSMQGIAMETKKQSRFVLFF